MSRYSTPDSDIGRLTIGGRSTKEKSDMPATTRSRTQRQRNLAASQRASSGTGAGSSRAAAGPSQTTVTSPLRRSSRQAQRQQESGGRRRTNEDESDDGKDGSDDDDDDDDDDDSEDGRQTAFGSRIAIIAYEVTAPFTESRLTPPELSEVDPRNTTDEHTTPQEYVDPSGSSPLHECGRQGSNG